MTPLRISQIAMLLRTYCSSATSQKKNSFPGIGDTLKILQVASICKALRSGGIDMNKSLSGLSSPSLELDEDVMIRIIRSRKVEAGKAFHFFKWARDFCKYRHSTNTYRYMIHRLCRSGDLDALASLLQDLRQNGHSLDPSLCKLLLHTFIKAGMFDRALEVFDIMEGCADNHLSPQLYNSLLIAFLKKGQVQMALSLLESMLKANIRPHAIAFNKLLISLRKANMRAEFVNIFSQLRTIGCEFDIWTYSICIHAFGVIFGKADTAEELFKELQDKGLAPDKCTYNSLIAVRCRTGRLQSAMNLLDSMKNEGLHPNVVTYGTLIRGLCQVSKVSEAFKLFNDMSNNGCHAEIFVYNALLDGLFKVGRLEDACQFFGKISEEGLIPNSITYNILIDGLIKKGREAAACKLFNDLKRRRQCVDGVTYSIMISYLCKIGNVEDALNLVEEMEPRGLLLDMVTVTTLLIALHKAGRHDWVNHLIKRIKDSSMIANIVRWTTEMQETTKFKKRAFKHQIFTLLKNYRPVATDKKSEQCKESDTTCNEKDLRRLVPDDHCDPVEDYALHTYPKFLVVKGIRAQSKGADSFDKDMFNTYIYLFSHQGRFKASGNLFRSMLEKGIEPGTYTYNTLLNGLVKKGYYDDAWEFFLEMGRRMCVADIATYNLVIDGLGKMGEIDMAYGILQVMLKNGGYIDTTLYNTLINTAGKGGQLAEAEDFFKRMIDKGLTPDVVTYNTLIQLHSKAGDVEKAYEFLKMMIDARCSPNHVTDNILDFLEKQIYELSSQKA